MPPLLCVGSSVLGLPVCSPVQHDRDNPGRCGPIFNYVRCNKNLKSWALYCNTDNGWCGDTPAHRDAQSSDAYDFAPTTSCTISTYDSGGYSAKIGTREYTDSGEGTQYPSDYSAKSGQYDFPFPGSSAKSRFGTAFAGGLPTYTGSLELDDLSQGSYI